MNKNLYFEYFNHLFNYYDRKVIDIRHSIERFDNRVGLPKSIWQDTIEKGIDKIISDYNDAEDNYIIVSKKYNFGIQVHWRPDVKEYDKIKHAFTATTLSKNELNYYINDDVEVLVENFRRNKSSYFRLEHIDEDMRELNYNLFVECGEVFHEYETIYIEDAKDIKVFLKQLYSKYDDELKRLS